MNYFLILGLAFGLVAMLKPFSVHILPWDENKALSKAYSRKRPRWVIPVAIACLLLVGITCYMEMTTQIPCSLIITLLIY